MAAVLTLAAGILLVPSAQGAGSVPLSVSLSAPASGVYGSTIDLTGAVWRTGTSTSLPGVTVWLQRSVHGQNKYGNLASTRTNSSGGFAFKVTQGGAFDYRTYYAGSGTYARAYSPVRYPVTNRYLALESLSTTSSRTGVLTAKGRAVPAPPDGTVVYLQRYSAEGRGWASLATGKLVSGHVTINAAQPGSRATYRLVTGALYPLGPGVSTSKQFSHYVWRGAFVKPLKSRHSNVGFGISQMPTEPTAMLAVSSSGTNGSVLINPDITGCLSAHSVTSFDNGFFVKPVTVQLATDKSHVSGAIESATATRELGLDIAGADYLRYAVSSDGTFDVLAKLELLCAN
ncbi:hypothetical protein [Kribbella deserti]|uniref:Carboxypeptidase regulatory-like domain-containing protein n=1 Tax=Kribbella deserti TaxID=1926257 RepID=A0ABV6QMZ2_9ACTN